MPEHRTFNSSPPSLTHLYKSRFDLTQDHILLLFTHKYCRSEGGELKQGKNFPEELRRKFGRVEFEAIGFADLRLIAARTVSRNFDSILLATATATAAATAASAAAAW